TEIGHALGRDRDCRAGARVAPGPRLMMTHAEAAETAQLDPFAGGERLGERGKAMVDEARGVAEAQLSPPRLQLVDELESGHPAAAQLAVATAPAILAIEPEFVADHVAHREALGFALPLQIGLHLLALLMLAQGLDRKSDPAFARIDLHDQRLDLVADLLDRRVFIDALVRDLRDMDQSLDTLFQLDEHAEVRHRGHLALDHAVERIAIGNALPRVRGELLYAEAHALVLGLDTQHDRLHLVAFLVNLGGMAHLARPREVGDMHEPVDSGFNL